MVALLHPDAVLRVDTGRPDSTLVHGAAAIAGQATRYRAPGATFAFPVVNGGPGIVTRIGDRVSAVLAFTVEDELIVEVDILADPDRLAALAIR